MKCSEFSGLVPSFLNDTLDDTSLREFLEHYDSCQGCREELEIQYLVDKVFNQMDAGEEVNLSKDLPEYIEKEKKLLNTRKRLSITAAVFESAAIAAAIVTVILYLI